MNLTPIKKTKSEDEEYDIENIGEGIIKGLEELVQAKKNGIELQILTN